MDRERLAAEMARGEEARALLAHPLLAAALAAVERHWTRRWRSSRTEEAGLREHAWQRLAALDEVRGQIASHVRTGALAAHQIDEEERRER